MISVVIPLFNEEKNISLLWTRLSQVFLKLGIDYELIFINDGSKDNTLPLIIELSNKDNHVKYISFSRNFGHQIAVSAGLDFSKGDYVTIIDADLQDPPELIEQMYLMIQEGYYVVYAKRKRRAGDSIVKKLLASGFYRILKMITSVDIPLDTGDFRTMRREVVEILQKMPEKNKYLRGQIPWIGFKQGFVEFDRDKRYAGETGYPVMKSLRLAIDGITAFSTFPIKLSIYMSFIAFIVSFFTIIYALYSKYIWKNADLGWTSLFIGMSFFGGVQLLCLGLMGEYISRIFDNVRNRPLYIVEGTNCSKGDGAEKK